MVMQLPRFFALESVDVSKYLRHVNEGDENQPDIKCTGEDVVTPYTKFEAEMASKVDKNNKGLVHIRCCYNNKYLVKASESSDLIVPRAKMPEEDDTNKSCTLFEPIFNKHGTTLQVRFKHAQLDQPLSVNSTASENVIRVNKDVAASYFNVVNWQSLLLLPTHVAFKRHDGQYVTVLTDYEDLVFTSDDAGDPTVGHEVVTTRDGSIRLKSDCLNKYWHQDNCGWIWPKSDSKDLFQPIRVSNNIIALRSLSNNKYCRSCKDGDLYYLRADVSTISRDTHFEVVELVLFRSVYNVVFRKKDSRIYEESEITMASGEVVNRTNVEDTIELKLSYEDTRTSSWNFSGSVTFGVQYHMKAGIPEICETGIEFSASITLGIQYTTTTSTTRLAETVYKVNVPARTRVKVSLKATKGKCDVPYSYTQCDTLLNGETETYRKDDGVFTGANCYNLSYVAEEKAL
ncbi:hypothetical protein MKX03_005123 [Papaver bracteatum]|nr:hypothetical protein MKX03_005123 [Papaver bracteatum]